MIRINLLPHREQKRRAKLIQFIVLSVISLILGVLVWGLAHTVITTQIAAQERRNAYLKQETDLLDKQIAEIKKLQDENSALLERKDAVEKLQSDRASVVHLLDQMLRILPDGVYLENLTQLNDGITLVGLAQSNARVSTLMRAIEDSAWLSSPSLVLIESTTVKNTRLNQFTLTFKLVKSKVDNKPDVGEVKKP